MGAARQAALCEQVIPRRQYREQRRGDRRHAAGGDQCGLRAFQGRELGMQRELARGVVGTQVAHVVVAAFAAVLIGRGLEDRHLHRARDARQRLAGVYQLGFDTHGGFGHWWLAKVRLSLEYATVSPCTRPSASPAGWRITCAPARAIQAPPSICSRPAADYRPPPWWRISAPAPGSSPSCCWRAGRRSLGSSRTTPCAQLPRPAWWLGRAFGA